MPATLALWDFNSPSPDGNPVTGTTTAAVGSGTLAAIGGVSTSFVSGTGSTDPAGADDSALSLSAFPTQGTANKTAGVQLAVDTTGYGAVILTFDQKNSAPASGRGVVQYSTNGGTSWTDAATLTSNTVGTWLNTRTVDLSGVAAAANNPNLRLRIVSAFNGASYPGTSGGYSPSGTWALDSIKVEGSALPTVTVAKITDAVEGGTAGTFRFTRTGSTSSALTVNVSASGTATAGTDFTAPTTVTFGVGNATVDYTVTATDDSTSEPTETVIFTVSSGTGYVAGSPATATVSILDNDTQVVSVVKASDAAEDGGSGAFLFSRTGDLSSALTVYYTVDGTATVDDDYEELLGEVTFAANSATAEVEVVALADLVADPIESVELAISTDAGYSLGSYYEATVDILTTALYDLEGGEWINLGGTGDETGWLVVGEDGGVWFATGAESDMEFAGLATWTLSEGPAVAYMYEEGQDDAPEPAADPPDVAPPPRLTPAPGSLPPIVTPPGPTGWSIELEPNNTIIIKNGASTIVATIYPDGSAKIYAGTTSIIIKASPKSAPNP